MVNPFTTTVSKASPSPPRMFQSLQEESRRAQEQKTDVLSQLQAADASKHGMEEKLAELHRLNMQLQVSPPSHDLLYTA